MHSNEVIHHQADHSSCSVIFSGLNSLSLWVSFCPDKGESLSSDHRSISVLNAQMENSDSSSFSTAWNFPDSISESFLLSFLNSPLAPEDTHLFFFFFVSFMELLCMFTLSLAAVISNATLTNLTVKMGCSYISINAESLKIFQYELAAFILKLCTVFADCCKMSKR